MTIEKAIEDIKGRIAPFHNDYCDTDECVFFEHIPKENCNLFGAELITDCTDIHTLRCKQCKIFKG